MQKLVWSAALLALLVVSLGAFVRLSEAGLGCPDWPGCYGHATPFQARGEIARVVSQFPEGPVSLAKAWKEMTHRYVAGLLGILVFVMWLYAWRQRRYRGVATLLVGVVGLQALLGMWTVTQLLKPVWVACHLVLGMLLVSGLMVFALAPHLRSTLESRRLLMTVWGLCAIIVIQILLGGWVSANGAALACQGFPMCNGSAWPAMLYLREAFYPMRNLGEMPDGLLLPWSALVSIHWVHRIGALWVSLFVLLVVAMGWRVSRLRKHLVILLTVCFMQLGLGVANVLLLLPLPIALAHNMGGLVLLTVSLLLAVRVTLPLNAKHSAHSYPPLGRSRQ